jgi:hypothetical protein
MIHPLTDHVSLTVWSWTISMMLAFGVGLAVGLWLRRPRPLPSRRTSDERDTLDGTETMGDLLRRCRQPENR